MCSWKEYLFLHLLYSGIFFVKFVCSAVHSGYWARRTLLGWRRWSWRACLSEGSLISSIVDSFILLWPGVILLLNNFAANCKLSRCVIWRGQLWTWRKGITAFVCGACLTCQCVKGRKYVLCQLFNTILVHFSYFCYFPFRFQGQISRQKLLELRLAIHRILAIIFLFHE